MGERVARRRRRRRRRSGWSPGSLRTTVGSPRCGAAAAASANFDENSPNTACALRSRMRPNVATSQNIVDPPLPSTISQPSGRPNSSVQTGADRADEVLHRRLAVGRAEQRCCRLRPGRRPARGAPWRARSRTDRRRAAGCDRDRNGAWVGRCHCASMAAMSSRLPQPRAAVSVSAARRASARLASIAESATLAVDAKAKALKAQGRERHRVRRRRTRLPDAREHRRGRGRGVPRSEEPQVHARRRPARAARGDRGEDPARQRLRDAPPARCW